MIFLIINKSIELYSLAANTGNDAAQIILEDAYMNSDGVKKDVERRPQIKEMKWLWKLKEMDSFTIYNLCQLI